MKFKDCSVRQATAFHYNKTMLSFTGLRSRKWPFIHEGMTFCGVAASRKPVPRLISLWVDQTHAASGPHSTDGCCAAIH